MKKNKHGEGTAGNILRILILALCGLILGLDIYILNAKNLVGEQMPMPFGYGVATVLSGSMEPEISRGDLVFVKEAETLIAGDIIVYQDINGLVVHRVVEVSEKNLITKGDANNAADTPIPVTAVKGKVFFWVPLAGHLIIFMRTGVGAVLTLAVAFLLIEMPNRKTRKRVDEERQRIIEEIERLRSKD